MPITLESFKYLFISKNGKNFELNLAGVFIDEFVDIILIKKQYSEPKVGSY